MRERLIHSIQQQVEIDEPEVTATPKLPEEPHRFTLGRDDHSTDTVVDVIREEQLLRGLEGMTPTDPSTNSWSEEHLSQQKKSPLNAPAAGG